VSARSVFAASPGYADFTGTLAATSEYMFRDIETSEGAAVQGSLNYEHDTGFYASVWGSNIDETLGSIEVDVYGGWKGDLGGVGVEVGATQYLFSQTNEDVVLEEGLDVIVIPTTWSFMPASRSPASRPGRSSRTTISIRMRTPSILPAHIPFRSRTTCR
jgi:uncharacterized protein (TIGR02001 family)